MSDRPGFVSVSGMLAAGVALLVVLGWTVLDGPVLFSPGPLNSQTKGRTLGGVTNHAQAGATCGDCHTAPWSSQTMALRCVSCHTAIADEVRTGTKLHGAMLGRLSTLTCRGCHTEHHGPKGQLTVLDETTFPHELTGYSLRGHSRAARGGPFACADCHGSDLAHFDQRVCATCHSRIDAKFMSAHETAFGMTCLLCHKGTGGDGANFDHSKVPFKLTGKHVGLACERCHSSARSPKAPQYTPQDCYSCHATNDKHKGAFGQQCGQCHTTAGWSGATFDHTIFPVDHGSRGRPSACGTCHPNGVSTYSCYGCHEHTPANIQSEHGRRTLAELANCIRCHSGGGSGEGGGGD
jgi:hypothetical protein